MRQRLPHARPELSRGALEFCDLREDCFVVDGILTVQGKQGLRQFVHGPRQAGGGPVGIGTSRHLGRECGECEFGHEEIVLHHGPAQRLGVIRDPPLQHLEPRFGIEEGNTYRDFAKVRSAEEAEWRLLQVVNLVAAGFRVGDDSLQVFEAAINEIDALPADGQPRPAVDPRAPFVRIVPSDSPKNLAYTAVSRSYFRVLPTRVGMVRCDRDEVPDSR